MYYKLKDNILTKVFKENMVTFTGKELKSLKFHNALGVAKQAGSLLKKLLSYKHWQFLQEENEISQEAEERSQMVESRDMESN